MAAAVVRAASRHADAPVTCRHLRIACDGERLAHGQSDAAVLSRLRDVHPSEQGTVARCVRCVAVRHLELQVALVEFDHRQHALRRLNIIQFLFQGDATSRVTRRRRMIYDLECISSEVQMQVAKWGNSLAVRLPAAVVEALDLKEGDDIEIRIAGKREFEVDRDRTKERALSRLRRLRRPLPAGFSFSREDER